MSTDDPTEELTASYDAIRVADARVRSLFQRALEDRAVIGQAQGLLMAHRRITAAEAFDELRRTSQRRHVPMRDVADELIQDAGLLRRSYDVRGD